MQVLSLLRRVLMKSPYSYSRPKGGANKKQAQKSDLLSSPVKQKGREGRSIPSETMLPRKKAIEKQREEKKKLKAVGNVIDGLLEEVMLYVAR